MSAEEGYTKYQCLFAEDQIEPSAQLTELIATRQLLYQLGLIGVLPDGVGYGNVSARMAQQTFLVSGSGTGGLALLDRSHFALVVRAEIDQNIIEARGMCRPSSESLTHAACYLASDQVRFVLHVHSAKIWNENLNRLPSTLPTAEYGTPEMAREVMRLVREDRNLAKGVVIMSGHQDGVIFYGRELAECLHHVSSFV